MKVKLTKIQWFLVLIMASLGYLSFEILIRRWAFQQIPTQITARYVYTLITANLFFISFCGYKIWQQKHTTR